MHPEGLSKFLSFKGRTATGGKGLSDGLRTDQVGKRSINGDHVPMLPGKGGGERALKNRGGKNEPNRATVHHKKKNNLRRSLSGQKKGGTGGKGERATGGGSERDQGKVNAESNSKRPRVSFRKASFKSQERIGSDDIGGRAVKPLKKTPRGSANRDNKGVRLGAKIVRQNVWGGGGGDSPRFYVGGKKDGTTQGTSIDSVSLQKRESKIANQKHVGAEPQKKPRFRRGGGAQCGAAFLAV